MQVFDTLKQDTVVYECKKLAAKYLVKLIQLLGVTLKIENYCFLDTLFFNCISIVLCLTFSKGKKKKKTQALKNKRRIPSLVRRAEL